jgi:hypothetical protein
MKEVLAAVVSRFSAVALLIAAVAALLFGIVMPTADRYETLRADLAQKRLLLGRLLAQNEAHKDDLAVRTPTTRHLSGETDAVRLAGLQSLLNEAADGQNIRIISSRSVDPVDRDGIRLLGISAQMKTPIEHLQKLLFSLEHGQGALVVESLQLSQQKVDGTSDGLDVNLILRGTAPLAGE